MNRKITALYCRFSRDEDNLSNSVVNQQKFLEEYALTHGFSDLKVYIDDGYSGTNFNRPDFQKMYTEIEVGNIDTVIVKDMSRFGRNYLEVGKYLEIVFAEKNIRFIAVNDNIDTTHGLDDFFPFRNVLNEFYARDISKKVKTVLDAKAARGEHINSITPYGYMVNPDNPKEWIVDTEAAEIVKKIFTLYASGFGSARIAKILTDEGILTPFNHKVELGLPIGGYGNNNRNQWSETCVRRILSRKDYLGYTINHKTRKVPFKSKKIRRTDESERLMFEATHEAIIDRELFDTVAKMLNERKANRTVNSYKDSNPYAGLAYCSDCGAKMCRKRYVNHTHDYYCSAYDKHGKCSIHSTKTALLNQLVFRSVKYIHKMVTEDEKAFLFLLERQSSDNRNDVLRNLKKELRNKTSQAENIQAALKHLYQDRISDILDNDQFTTLYSMYNTELVSVNNDISKITKDIYDCESKNHDIKNFIYHIKNTET